MVPNGWIYPVGNLVIRTGLRLFARHRVEGAEAVPPFGPLLVVSNHLSVMDPPLLAVSIPQRRLHYLAKEGVFRTPLIRYILNGYGAFPVARQGKDLAGLRWALARLNEDQAIVLFPEGTRSPKGLRHPIMGMVQLHLWSGAPILPVAITGTEHLGSIPRIFFPTGEITVRIGSPFTLPMVEGRLERAQRTALADMVMQRIADLLPESYRGVYARKTVSSPSTGDTPDQ